MLKFSLNVQMKTVMSQKDLFCVFKSVEMFPKKMFQCFFFVYKTAYHAQKGANFNEIDKDE